MIATTDLRATLDRLVAFTGLTPKGADPAIFRFADGTRIEVELVEAEPAPGRREAIERVIFSVAALDALDRFLTAQAVETTWDEARAQRIVGPREAAGAKMAFEQFAR